MGADMAPFSYFIFDLDGTILDTIEDIALAMNAALQECGYSYGYSKQEAMRLIGDGADMAVRRALAFHNEDLRGFQRLKDAYMPLYRKLQNDHVKPFAGLKDTLTKLKESGAKLYVVTNKPHALAEVVVASHYGEGFFVAVSGAKEGVPVKPDPTSLLLTMEENGIPKDKALYVGDSSVDIATAKNGGLPCALCLWGYGVYDETTLKTADYILKKPEDLLSFVS